MHILILGSEGFIGSNAVKFFKKKGYKVTCADIILKEEDDYILINPELPSFSSVFLNSSYDVCLNATGAANVQLSFAHPGFDFILNTANVYSILDSIRLYNSNCKFINLSSAAVYGNPPVLPVVENTITKPLSPYGFHKLYSEQICKEFNALYDIETISLRIFSAYGENLKKQLFWDLNKKINNSNGVIELFGTGKETRDFIYIQDLLEAVSLVIIKANFDGGVINIGSGIESTIEEAVKIFIKCLNIKVTTDFMGNTKKGDPLNWRADISFLKSIGFQPYFNLEQGLKNYVKWLEEKE